MSTDQGTGITVRAGVLRRSLAAVMPAAGTDDTLPILNTIAVEAGRGVLTMTATDRYLAAHARCEASGSLELIGLRLATAKLVMAHLRRVKPLLELNLIVHDGRLVFDLPDVELRLPLADATGYPKMAPIFTPMEPTLSLEEGRSFRLSVRVLTALSRILTATGGGMNGTQWHRATLVKPIMVEYEDWLTVAVMPMRKEEPTPARVPFGLPAAPKAARSRKAAAVKAVAPVAAKAPRRRAS